MDVKVGDVVHVRATVRVTGRDSAFGDLVLAGSTGEFSMWSSDVVHVEPRPLQVGDRVKICGADDVGAKIVAIVDDDAWVEWSAPLFGEKRSTVALANLERA